MTRRAGVLLAGVAFLSLTGHALRLMFAPIHEIAAFVPDDGCYYLGLGREFAAHGRWSFDGGRTLTSGFHPLWAWLLAGLHAATGGPPERALRVGLALGASLALVAFVVPLAWRRTGGPALLLALAVIVSSPNTAQNAASLMEWPLVVLAGAMLVRALEPGRHPWTAAAAGLTGSLARTDFWTLPLGLLAGAAWCGNRAERRVVLRGLLGGAAGVGVALLHNRAFTGEWLQSSARIKLHWAVHAPDRDPVEKLTLLVQLVPGVLPASRSAFLVVLCGLAAVLAAPALRAFRRPDARFAGGIAAIALAAALYALGPLPPPWYTAGMVVPALLVLHRLTATLAGPRERGIAVAVCAALIVRNVAAVHLVRTPPWPWQPAMLAAGQALAAAPAASAGGTGAWNAGYIGYFAGGTIVNIDGLVNNDVVPAILAGRLVPYLADRNLVRIVDFEGVFSPEFARRSGFDPADLRARIRSSVELARVPDGARAPFGRSIRLWTLNAR